MSKLVIIDGHAIMYRAFHAMPPLTTPKGEPINAVQGTVSMLLKIIEELNPTHIAFCFDEKGKTFRNKLDESYQAQRPPMPNDLSPQFEKIKDFLAASKIPWYSKDGFEADDVIGTLAKQATENSKFEIRNSKLNEVVIVTGDRDQLQLVDNGLHIKLFMPIAGLSAGKIFGEKETIERMGVAPSQIPDLKSLVGDPSDNYFGVSGVGPKTAINLLSNFKNIKNIYANLDKVKESVRKKLEKGRESCELSYKLAVIVTDVPLEFDFNNMDKWKLNSQEVLDLFINKFGFKTLTERIKKLCLKLEQEKQGSLF